jgi:hypothetical protein
MENVCVCYGHLVISWPFVTFSHIFGTLCQEKFVKPVPYVRIRHALQSTPVHTIRYKNIQKVSHGHMQLLHV